MSRYEFAHHARGKPMLSATHPHRTGIGELTPHKTPILIAEIKSVKVPKQEFIDSVYEFVKAHPGCSASEIIQGAKVYDQAVRTTLSYLRSQGLVILYDVPISVVGKTSFVYAAL